MNERSINLRHTYMEDIAGAPNPAVYHAYLIATRNTDDTYSFQFRSAYGKKFSKLTPSEKSETSYKIALRQFESTVTGKQYGKQRTYKILDGTPENGLSVADTAMRNRIIARTASNTTAIPINNAPDKSTLNAIKNPTWIAVLTPKPMINIVCQANTLQSHRDSSIDILNEDIKRDAKTIGGGIQLFGYEDNNIFYVANVDDEANKTTIMGQRLQKFATLLKALDIKNIKLCQFAINEQKKKELVDKATAANGMNVIFLAADQPATYRYIKYPT